jgi:hypothetical protein
MSYRIMNDQDVFSGLEYPTLEEAEEALKLCPKGWWVDKWLDLYEEWKSRYFVYNLDDIQERYQ